MDISLCVLKKNAAERKRFMFFALAMLAFNTKHEFLFNKSKGGLYELMKKMVCALMLLALGL